MYNCGLLKFKDISTDSDVLGHLTPIEGKKDVPFEIKRVYYITRVGQGITRGFHSHKNLHQVLLCLNGSIKIRVKTPMEEQVFELNDPSVGLYIGPLVWREMFDFTEGSVLMVLASEYYDENDYIRDYNYYLEEAGKRF